MLKTKVLIAVLAAMGMLMAVEAASAAIIKINCQADNLALRKALKNVEPGTVLKITKGVCRGGTIAVDDVTVKNGIVKGPIFVVGASRVVLDNLIVRGSLGNGVDLDGAFATIQNSTIKNNKGHGIQLTRSEADITGNSITGNGDVGDFDCGIGVFWQSQVFSQNNTIKGNGYCVVDVGQSSHFRSGLTGGDPAEADIMLQDGCTQGQPAGSCGTNGSLAIDVFRLGLVELRNTNVTGSVEVGGHSIIEMRGPSELYGDVLLRGDSGARIRKTVKGNGTLNCLFGHGLTADSYACNNSFDAP